jgi:hypothetical protein
MKAVSSNSLSHHVRHQTPNIDVLKFTVDLLKSISVGAIVRLGVQNPLPYPDAIEPMKGDVGKIKKKRTQAKSSYELRNNGKSDKFRPDQSNRKNIAQLDEFTDTQKSSSSGSNLEDESDERLDRRNMTGFGLNKYGIVATSAPAILNELFTLVPASEKLLRRKTVGDSDQDDEDVECQRTGQETHSFYSSTSLLKLNTIGWWTLFFCLLTDVFINRL